MVQVRRTSRPPFSSEGSYSLLKDARWRLGPRETSGQHVFYNVRIQSSCPVPQSSSGPEACESQIASAELLDNESVCRDNTQNYRRGRLSPFRPLGQSLYVPCLLYIFQSTDYICVGRSLEFRHYEGLKDDVSFLIVC